MCKHLHSCDICVANEVQCIWANKLFWLISIANSGFIVQCLANALLSFVPIVPESHYNVFSIKRKGSGNCAIKRCFRPQCLCHNQVQVVSKCYYASWCKLVQAFLTSQLESVNQRKRVNQGPELTLYALMQSFSHASHQCGCDSLSPIAVYIL